MDGAQAVGLPVIAGRSEQQNLLDQLPQLAGLAPQSPSIVGHLLSVFHNSISNVIGSRANHSQWRSQLVRNAGHEVNLKPGQFLHASGSKNDDSRRDG